MVTADEPGAGNYVRLSTTWGDAMRSPDGSVELPAGYQPGAPITIKVPDAYTASFAMLFSGGRVATDDTAAIVAIGEAGTELITAEEYERRTGEKWDD